MTLDDHGRPPGESWPTLTEAAERTGYTREALRLRVRRGKLRATKGNDGILRLDPRDLADLPPHDATVDDHGRPGDGAERPTPVDLGLTVDVLRATVDDLRDDLGQTRSALDAAQADRLVDRGRAERAEAQAAAEAARAAVAEARLAAAEVALAEARTPWTVRVIRAWRGRTG